MSGSMPENGWQAEQIAEEFESRMPAVKLCS
jgi:hypothetical protein